MHAYWDVIFDAEAILTGQRSQFPRKVVEQAVQRDGTGGVHRGRSDGSALNGFSSQIAFPVLRDNNARVARNSFEAFRRTVHPEMLWNPFVLRITRELEYFAEAYEGGRRPKLAFCTPPQHGKSLSAEDFAAWMSGRQPNKKTIYASYSEDLGTRMSLSLQRLMVSRRYREVFPRMMVACPVGYPIPA